MYEKNLKKSSSPRTQFFKGLSVFKTEVTRVKLLIPTYCKSINFCGFCQVSIFTGINNWGFKNGECYIVIKLISHVLFFMLFMLIVKIAKISTPQKEI